GRRPGAHRTRGRLRHMCQGPAWRHVPASPSQPDPRGASVRHRGRERVIREQIRALVAGGVPDINGRYALVSDLIGLGDEQPEVDLEAQHEILLRAARAIFADGLLLDSGESRLVDAHIERAKAQMELSENMT